MSKLKKYRELEKLTQQELATIVGVTPDYISMIERNKQTPGLMLAKKLADLFCTTVDDLFFDNESNKNFDNKNSA